MSYNNVLIPTRNNALRHSPRMKLFCSNLCWSASLILVTALLLTATDARAQKGPYDYSNAEHRRSYLGVVDSNHFNKDVENLVGGMTGSLYDDLQYTLRLFPNHHRALNSMARLYRRGDGGTENAPRSLDDFFQAAIRFQPRDPMPHMIYAVHFQKLKDYDKALNYYQNAIKLELYSPSLHYNLGLLYAETEDYEKALYHAKQAYAMGYALPGLRNKLIKAEVWE